MLFSLRRSDLPRKSTTASFAGPGLMFFLNEHTALSLGYRFHHISNAGKCSPNLGVNSSLIMGGLSYFFH